VTIYFQFSSSHLRVEDWSKGRHSTGLELKDYLFREPRVTDHTHSLRVKFPESFLDNWHHVHSPAVAGINEKWARVKLPHEVEDVSTVCSVRVPRLPDDPQWGAFLLAQKRETWPYPRSCGNHNHPAKNSHHVDKAVHEHSTLPQMSWLLIDTPGCPIACLGYYARKALAIGIRESCKAVPIPEWMLGECYYFAECSRCVIKVESNSMW